MNTRKYLPVWTDGLNYGDQHLTFWIADNLERVLAIELFNAAQALDFRRPLKSSEAIEAFVAEYRKHVEFVKTDKVMYTEIAKSVNFLQQYDVNI